MNHHKALTTLGHVGQALQVKGLDGLNQALMEVRTEIETDFLALDPITDAERLDFLLDLENITSLNSPLLRMWNFATDTLPAEGYDAREHKLRQINLTLALLKTYEEFCK